MHTTRKVYLIPSRVVAQPDIQRAKSLLNRIQRLLLHGRRNGDVDRICTLFLLITSVYSYASAQTTGSRVTKLADRFVTQELMFDPTLSYSTGLTPRDNIHFADRSRQAIAAHYAKEREDEKLLLALPIAELTEEDRATYATLREQLESDLQLQVCRTELWNVNHFDGWQSRFAEVANRQPVGTAAERKQAIQRWSSLPHYLNVEIANLTFGLAHGYSAPQSVVRRVIQQMNDLVNVEPDRSAFYSPARRSTDAAFQIAFADLIRKEVNPALRHYRDFLQVNYLPRARNGIAITDLPDGAACYQAFLRANTTLSRTPREVYDIGQKTVQENMTEVSKLGKANYGSTDVMTIVADIKSKAAEHFQSREDLLEFSQHFLDKAEKTTAAQLISPMPQQGVVIRALSAFEEDAGVGSRFQHEPNPREPAVYLINLKDWQTETKADAEIVTVHETAPGHYLQEAMARTLQPQTRLSKYVDNAAYVEGWARYAEALGEEAEIYDTPDAAVMRRLWPAHGMVVDPGLHAFHWTRQQAIDYMVSSGHFSPNVANDYVDRIAVMPGQLTSYDSGALEIESLRAEAVSKLGTRFDLRRFDRAVLEEGVVPLIELRAHIEAWIAENGKSALPIEGSDAME